VSGNGVIRQRAQSLARRLRVVVAATAIAGGSIVAASASASPALASRSAPLAITATSFLTATAGSAYQAKLGATGGTKPYTWSLGGGSTLPAGLELDASTGKISGTPAGPSGTFDFTAEVTDSESPPVSATASESITVTVTALTVTTVSLPAATAGASYSATLAATGGVGPYTWSIPLGSLPAGLKLHAATGVISGTAAAGGNFSFVAAVTDSETEAQVSSASESISVIVAGLVVTTGSLLPTATSGVIYSVKLGAAGGVTPYQWSLASGALPAGLKLKSTGVLSGTTTATGQDNFTVQVTDSEAATVSATENVSLYVVNPVALPADLPGAAVNQSYDTSLQPAGGLAPYSYAITAGSLPAGLTLQPDGEITGDASAGGTSPFTVSVTDSENPPVTVTQAESITVAPASTTCAADVYAYDAGYLEGSTGAAGSGFLYVFGLEGGSDDLPNDDGVVDPTGTITYTLVNSQNVAVDTETSQVSGTTVTYSPTPSGTYTNEPDGPGYHPTAAGNYEMVATYSGDANNSGCEATASLSVTLATPSISAIANSDSIGDYDTATLQDGFSVTGTVTFNLYGPFAGAPTCTSPVFSQTVSVDAVGFGSGGASSEGPSNPTLTSPGTYYWTATYNGNAGNASAATNCGDPNEEVTVPGS
jgi:hypothetical protein